MGAQTSRKNSDSTASGTDSSPAAIELLRSGDLDTWASTIQRHNQRLYRLARSILRDDAEAEDVVQETYVRAYLRLGEFRGPQGFRTWLSRIATNEALMRLRRSRRMVRLDDIDAAALRDAGALPCAEAPSAEAQLMGNELAGLIESAVDALPDEFRPVFALRNLQQLSTRETAECLGVPETTVKTRLHRANRLVRARVSAQIEPGDSGAFGFGGHRCSRLAELVLSRIRALRDAQQSACPDVPRGAGDDHTAGT
ncbi:MAG: RNA polymerase sigma factor [Gammaproteobacteria bacterium]|jgi:RNA polymerase sigma-70 factor (ECF subfamily)